MQTQKGTHVRVVCVRLSLFFVYSSCISSSHSTVCEPPQQTTDEPRKSFKRVSLLSFVVSFLLYFLFFILLFVRVPPSYCPRYEHPGDARKDLGMERFLPLVEIDFFLSVFQCSVLTFILIHDQDAPSIIHDFLRSLVLWYFGERCVVNLDFTIGAWRNRGGSVSSGNCSLFLLLAGRLADTHRPITSYSRATHRPVKITRR